MQLLHGEDRLRDQPQHHGRPPQRVEQVDPDAHEGKGVGPIEFLLAKEGIDLLRREDLLQPALEGGQVGAGPFRGLHFAAGAIARHFTDSEMHIGMAGVMGDANDLLQAGGAVGPGGLRCRGRRGLCCSGLCCRGLRDGRRGCCPRARREAGWKHRLGHGGINGLVPASFRCPSWQVCGEEHP